MQRTLFANQARMPGPATLPAAAALALILTVIGSAIAVTAHAASPPGARGEAAEALSGYVIGDPSYRLNPDDPAIVDAVAFEIEGAAPAGFAKVRLDTDGVWYACAVDAAANPVVATCDTTSGVQLAVADVNEFRVIAASGAE